MLSQHLVTPHILYTLCRLYSVYCTPFTLYSVLCTLYSMYCALCVLCVLSTLYFVYYVLCTLCTQYSVLCVLSTLCTLYSVPYLLCTLYSIYSVLCALCTLCTLDSVHYVKNNSSIQPPHSLITCSTLIPRLAWERGYLSQTIVLTLCSDYNEILKLQLTLVLWETCSVAVLWPELWLQCQSHQCVRDYSEIHRRVNISQT